MELIKPGSKIPFTRYRKIAFIVSTMVNLAVLAFLFVKGPNLGVDFAGGTIVQLKFQQRTTIPDIRQALETIGLGSSTIQEFGQEGAFEFLIRVEKTGVEVAALSDQMKKALLGKFGADKVEIRRVEYVGPKIGEDLRWRGTISVIACHRHDGRLYLDSFRFGVRRALRFAFWHRRGDRS